MKKIYTFIAVASLMLTSVLSFTSCQKDELPAQKTKTTSNTNNNGNSSQAVYVTVTSSTPDHGSVDVNNLLSRKAAQD